MKLTPWQKGVIVYCVFIALLVGALTMFVRHARADDGEPTVEEMRGMLMRMHAYFKAKAEGDEQIIRQLIRDNDRLRGTPASCI